MGNTPAKLPIMTKQQFKEAHNIDNDFCLEVYYRIWCIKNSTGDGWGEPQSLRALMNSFKNCYCYYSQPAERVIRKPSILAAFMAEVQNDVVKDLVYNLKKEHSALMDAKTFLNNL